MTPARSQGLRRGDEAHPARARGTTRARAHCGGILETRREAPEYARPCYVTLVITGMRVGEYLTLGLEHLRPESCAIQVPGTKTAASSAVVAVDPEYWPWIEAAVPSPLGYKWLRINFKNAAKAIGRADLRLHDLRHVFAQLASDAGAPTAQVQAALRHPNPATMRR